MTSCPRRSRMDGGRSTFSQAVAPARSGAWMRSRMASLVNRLLDGLLGAPLGEVGQAPLGEAVRGVHHGAVAVEAGKGLAQDARAVLRVDAPVAAHADLREPHPAHGAGLAVAQLDGHADAAHVAVAVVRERPLACEEALHRRQRDAADVAWSGPLEEPEGHSSSCALRSTEALRAPGGGAPAVAR